MDQRPLLSRPQSAEDWENRKAAIVELYESKTLKETMTIMENKHSFKATEKQYKKQLQKWDIDHKRIKSTEYKAMIKKKRQREEHGQTDVKFQLRGLEVDDAKIVRFQKRHRISEPEQVFDCPTPPNLICTTPAPIPPSPNPRLFDWYDKFEEYLDFSLAGAPTIQSNNVQSILRSLVVPLPNYEDECRSLSDWPMKTYDIFTCTLLAKSFLYSLSVMNLGRVPGPLNTRAEAFTASAVYRLQKFLRYVVHKFLDRLGNHTYSLPSLDSSGKFRVLWVAKIAGTIYRLSGRRGEAIRLLETIIPLVIQHVDLKETYVWLLYNEMVMELAYCCAEDGHGREARHLLNNKLDWQFNLNRKATKTVLERFSVETLRKMLQGCKEYALQLVGQLEKGRAGTHFMHEHHAQLQEGSSQPETSEWGPFLTDRVDWDKI